MRPRRFQRWAIIAGLLLTSAAGLSSQQRQVVRCDLLVGFNGVARESRFAPVVVSIENPGPRMKAEIALRVSWGGIQRGTSPGRTITREAILDAGSTRRFPFVIPVPRNARELRAAVTSEGVEVGSLEVQLRPMTTTSRIVAGAISSEFSLDNLSSLAGAGSIRVVYPRVDDLPRSWSGYDGVDAVIVHDTYFQQLRSDQVAALERWVVTGGVLVFTGGAAALQHAPAGFGRLLPVRITGLVRRTGLAAVPVGRGAMSRVPGSVEVAESSVTNGSVIAADRTLPLVVQRRLGRGSIWFLAFDPTAAPLSAWGGSLSLWRTMLDGDRLPTMGAALRPAMEDSWIAGLFAASAVSFPPVSSVLVFIGGYVALLVPLLAGRRRLRARTRLTLIVGVSLLGVFTGWILFNRVLFRPGLQVIDAARLEARSGDGLAFVVEKAGLFASAAQAADVRCGSPDAVIEAAGIRTRQDLPPSDTDISLVYKGSWILVKGIGIERLGATLLAAQDIVAFPVVVRVRPNASSVTVLVSNGGSKPLLGCFIIVSGRAYPLGDAAAGASIQRTFAAAAGLASSADDVVSLTTDGRRAALLKAEMDGENPGSGPPRLIGWMDGPALPLSFEGGRPVGGRPGLVLVSVESE